MGLTKLIFPWFFFVTPIIAQEPQYHFYQGDPLDSLEVLRMLDSAKDVYRLQEYDSVLLLSETILNRAIAIDFVRGVGESEFIKARALNRLGYRKKAIETYGKALEAFSLIGDHHRIAGAYNNQGLISRALGEFREAIVAGEKALKLVSSTRYTRLYFQVLNNLGNSYQSLAQFKNASASYFESLKVLKAEPDTLFKERMQAEVYINLGIIYYEQKLFSKALEIYHEARKILEEQNLKPQLAAVYNNLGVTYTDIQEFTLAESYLSKARKLNTELNYGIGLAICTHNFGKIQFAKGKFVEAIAKHKTAIQELTRLNALTYLPSIYLELGNTFLAADLLKDAQLSLMKGLQIALTSGQKIQELDIYEGLITLHKITGDLQMALMYYDLFSSLTEELNDQQIGRFIGQKELQNHIEKRDLALQSLESEAALLNIKISQRNTLLIMSISIMMLLTTVFIMAYRQHQLKSRNRNYQLEQRLLMAQLNPHFIFNALGAIQDYMCNKSPQEAARYLAKFSKLMRTILESSRMGMNSLSKEIETIKNYLDLQSLRFPRPFTYSVEMDPQLDADMIMIPALIMQPLVENALEHGLQPNQGGELKIDIKEKEDKLRIAIEDDGVGFNPALNRKKNNPSLGNTMTIERISSINRGAKNKIHFQIENRSLKAENHAGTRALLYIPIN